MVENLPLTAQLSAAFVALAIEIDNSAEQSIAHYTTSFGGSTSGSGSGRPGTVWLVSIAMWFNAIRTLADRDDLTVAEVRRRSGLDTNVDGLRRWGYATVDGIGSRLHGEKRPIPKASSVLRLTRQGRDAAAVWAPLPAAIDQRWRDRFGATAVDRLRAALGDVAQSAQRGLPEYLPILGVDLWTRHQRQEPQGTPTRPGGSGPDDAELPLLSLLARVLLALTLDYETDARLALPMWANGLRVLTREPTPVRDLPARAGVAAEVMATMLKHLERIGATETTPIPGGRGKQVRLTERGALAESGAARRFVRLGEAGGGRTGSAMDELRAALEPVVGDGTRSGSPLFDGLKPTPGGWRAQVRPPASMPWYPLLLHRGGYPDGS